MPATNKKPALPTPASPRNTAKYTNKDGSKFITVPKSTPSDSSQPSTPTIATKPVFPPLNHPTPDAPVQAVNRKKQKRRQKALAKAAAAEQAANALPDPSATSKGPSEALRDDQDVIVSDEEEVEDVRNGDFAVPGTNGYSRPAAKSKKNKKKKKRNAGEFGDFDNSPAVFASVPQMVSQDASRPSGMSRDKIWSTSNHEERERIKEFWLGLGEDERKSLVKVEKDAVLKKMKEQQKHTCSCSVCGRKRTAIEEELEGLYDAYYLELEQFANHSDGPRMLQPPPRDFPPRPRRRLPSHYTPQQPSHGRIVEHVADEDEEDELEEVYSEDEAEDDEYSDDEPPEQFHNPYDRDMTDFLAFGSSLQVKGGILTVADDLLKNDGKRFIEMMEQLAERRMAREEDAREHFSRGYGHPSGSYSTPHNHPPDDNDYEDEEDEEEDYEDSQDEEYEDEEDQMTEEQRMEEGRRMFQIFAARMFEQRVLSAYKEKVAKERQDKLLEELEEESRQVDQQKARKAKNAQKKKDKAAQKKQALAEEKARKEAEKAAEEAARLEADQKRVAEQRQKAEEKRRQKESQKKAEEEARLRKEADRQRRVHEQRERQAEQERRAREAKERERKLKEEQRQKDKQARDQREREAQERKEKQERDKREKEARAAKAQKELQEATQRAKEDKANHKSSIQTAQSQPIQIAKRGHGHTATPLSTVLPQHPPNPASYASPKIPVATPAIPKAPTPIRYSSLSQQQDCGPGSSAASQSASGPSQNPSPHPGTPIQAGAGPIGQERKASTSSSILAAQLNQPVSPHSIQVKLPSHTPPFQMPPTTGLQPPLGLAQHRPPRFPSPISHEAIFPPLQFRPGPNMMMAPPGLNGPGARGFPPGPMAPPGFNHASTDPFPMNQAFPMAKEPPIPTHTRQGSTGYDGAAGLPTQPIGRPAPIGRPGSLSQRQSREEDDETKHLGSSALVADDEPPLEGVNPGGLRNQPPGPRGGFATSPFMDAGFPMGQNPWGPPVAATHGQPFAPPGFPNSTWGSPGIAPGFGMTGMAGMASPTLTMNSIRSSSQPRHVMVRSLLCTAYRDLSASGSADAEGYMDLGAIKSQVDMYANDVSLTEQDLLNLCDTEGNSSNGGGTFDVKRDMGGVGQYRIRWTPDQSDASGLSYRAVGAPGEICSPRTNHASLRGH